MAVVIETTLGDITVDLYLDQRPVTCLNFLKLCKMKYYNFNLFHSIRSGFIAQTGDPTGEGSGGQSIWGILEGPEKRFFSGEKMPKIRHSDAGLLAMVCTGDMMVGSQFYFTLAPDLNSLDGTHCVIGEVTEGHDVLRKLNDVICDESHRPYRDVRITHTVVLEDPFNDPPGLRAPSRSPSPSAERLKGGRIAPDEEIDETMGKSVAEIQEMIEEKEAKARATILEIVGDLPDADVAPPENVLFVCKLNPVTTDDDLEIIFSRFGKIVSCEVIRDKKTGDSLQYAFIEFDDKKSCEEAYFKMDNVLIDDRRIHVDFSQSVSKIKWLGKGRGVKHIEDDNDEHISETKSKRHQSPEKEDTYSKNRNNSNRERHENRRHKPRDYSDNYKEKYSNDRERDYDRDSKREKRHIDKERNNTSRSHRNSYDNHKTRKPDNNNHKHNDSYNRDKHKNNYNSGRAGSKSPMRKRSLPRDKIRDNHTSTQKHKEDREERDRHKEHKNKDENNLKRKQEKEYESDKKIKKTKTEKKPIEIKTPPVENKEENKKSNDTKQKKPTKKSNSVKRKRKPSTSSSNSDSSDSSSSSDTSSSSDEPRKKKKTIRKRKKKYSSSSSSTDSSSSSSSSSSASSSDSSSSSDSDGKHKKNIKKKVVKKSKKKS